MSVDVDKSSNDLENLDAAKVYLLMNKQYRISRNRRAEWFFTRLNSYVEVPQLYKIDEFCQELDIVSVIPKKIPPNWNSDTSHLYRYRICPDTIVSVISKRYRLVYCIDISPSVASVDVQASMVMFDGIFDALKNSMKSLLRPFYVPGSKFLFLPRIYLTIIAHSSFLALNVEQILVQGVILNESTCHEILQTVFAKLHILENKVVGITTLADKAQAIEQTTLQRVKTDDADTDSASTGSIAMSPDFALVDLFRHAVIALSLLPENSAAGLIIITDGATSVPDGGYLDMVLSQLRYNTVSCSFIQLSSPFHPHVCYGILPYLDFMKFIANATSGAFITSVPLIENHSFEINAYHESLLLWNFQKSTDNMKLNLFVPTVNRPGVWSVRNKCFFSIRDMPIVKKQQYETTLSVDYLKVMSCRLREGFTIKDVQVGTDSIKIKLVLPWKFLIQMEYILITQWPPQQKVTCILSIEGPYDFLHDVTCLAKKPFHSYYRQLMVSRFWGYQKNLSESDKLLVHFNSFSSVPTYYNIPDSLRNGVPLFYISSSTSAPVLQLSDFAYPQFAQFWKPVCLLDTNIWQKWMHTHRIGVLLEHDHPFPKHLHLPNSSGRFHVIQCRQTMMALNTLLKDWSSFVLVENHSYIKLMYNISLPPPAPPISFCLIRTTTKPPCLVLRLAFLVGTLGHLRHSVVSNLLTKIAGLTFPQRLNEPPRWRVSNANVTVSNPDPSSKKPFKRTWSDMPCCIVLKKPVEKILIRHDRVPSNFFQTLLPQQSYNSWPNSKRSTTVQSTFGFRPTYSSPWGSSIKMGPEMFNTVARYLKHKRWIWCVQSTPTCPLSMECAARILSTITKMRLQEGLRFAFSTAGVINMVKELDMKVDSKLESYPEAEGELSTSPCVLQYVIFPPITSLFCAEGEEELEKATDEVDNSELYLVCECWVEPQSGRVVGAGDLDGLPYSAIHDKIFEVDQESIRALVTFDHLNLMCQNSNVPSPMEVPEREIKRPKSIIDTEEHIQYVSFSFDLTKILPKSQQAELTFSTFNQILPLTFSKATNDEAECSDQANILLYSAICSTLLQLHDREVMFAPHESRMIHEHIQKRNGKYDERSQNKNIGARTLPKWKCFIRRITENHVLLTFVPASFHDLKLLALSRDLSDIKRQNGVTHLVSREALEEELFQIKASLQGVLETSGINSVFRNSSETFNSQREYSNTEQQFIGRKRSRVKSGGESGPVSKKPLTRKTSIDNLFRLRANSADKAWRVKQSTRGKTNSGGGEASHTAEPSPTHVKLTGGAFFEENLNMASTITSQTLSFEDSTTQYGSIRLPVYVYDCSLATLTDHIIFRSNSAVEDIFIDHRYSATINHKDSEDSCESGSEEETKSSFGTPIKHRSPEPKSEDSEFLPSDKEALQNHCKMLEKGFGKSFVYGMFRSLQVGHYVYRGDVEVALRLCQETKIEIDMTEFIQTVCGHAKEGSNSERYVSGCLNSELPNTSSPCGCCGRSSGVHKFIQKRFQQIILSTFDNVSEVPGVYFFKLNGRRSAKSSTFRSLQESSKNTSDFEDVESSTLKSDSIIHEKTNHQDKEELIGLDGSNLELSEFTRLEELCSSDKFKNGTVVRCVPLFMYLTCTYTCGETLCSFLVQEIPMCLEDLKEAIAKNCSDVVFDQKGKLTMEFYLLTSQTKQDIENSNVSRSMCDNCENLNHHDKQQMGFSSSKDLGSVSFDIDEMKFPTLPENQLHHVKQMIEEVKWLLRDEITSFRWESQPLTENTLTLVASHIGNSVGKAACKVQQVPLSFVNNSNSVGYEKFRKRFSDLAVDGFHLKEEGSWFYLIDSQRLKTAQEQNSKALKVLLRKMSGEIDEVELTEGQLCSRADVEAEDPEIVAIDEKIKHKALRKLSGQELRHVSSDLLEQHDIKQGSSSSDHTEATPRFFLTTPSQLSEISSLLESVITNGEEGYEGDESGEDGDMKNCQEIRNTSNAFWMIFKLTSDQVKIFFHCRYNEDDLSVYKYSLDLCERIVKINKDLKRLVNQDLLLQDLDSTRKCSLLLEPENNEEDALEYSTSMRFQGTPTRQPSGDLESDLIFDQPNPAINPGLFTCPVVWETKFTLHSRLRTGPGKSLISRGIQTLQSALIVFEVVNRKNMFVYKDASGNVFYLRLYRIQEVPSQLILDSSKDEKDVIEDPFWLDSSSEDMRPRSGSTNERELAKLRSSETNEEEKAEDIVLLQVHGITPAGSEVKQQLVQSLRNKLDDAVLEILSITLERNPHCKLSPEDVRFIQKPASVPDYTVKFQICDYVAQNLSAFAYYMHQNLLNFFSMPKYTDLKLLSNRFRDYSRLSDNWEKNIYLYKQNPGDTGSRGIACLVVTIVDSFLQPLPTLAWKRPSAISYMDNRTFDEFLGLTTSVKETLQDNIMVELQVWKQGRISLDLLRSNLSTVIKHSFWDLIMEFYYLTAPLSIEFSPVFFDNAVQHAPSGRDKSTLSSPRGPFLNLSPRRAKLDPLAMGLSPLETGDKGHLHPVYDDLKKWCHFGNELNVPSLRIAPINLNCKHPIEIVVHETEKLVSSMMTEMGPKQFWKHGGNDKFVASGGLRNLQNKDFVKTQKFRHDFAVCSNSLKRLSISEFPTDLTSLFKEKEEFDPFSDGSRCIIIARNMINWKACISTLKMDSYSHEGQSYHHYRFPPLLASTQETSYLGLTPSCEIMENSQAITTPKHSILVPRQKLLWVNVTHSKIVYMFYNWPKESSDRLLDNTKRLSLWINARSSLLTSIYAQKSGLFHHQAIVRPLVSESVMNPYTSGSTDIDTFIVHQAPPKSIYPSRIIGTPGKKAKLSSLLLPCLESLRNLKHHGTLLKPPEATINLLKSQFIQLRNSTKIEAHTYRDGQNRNVGSENSEDVIQTFKRSARVTHFCMTPIIFFPRWRREVAVTRDNVTGIRKKTTTVSNFRKVSLHQSKGNRRSRHESDSSQGSSDLKTKSKPSIWSLWGNSNVNNQENQSQSTTKLLPSAHVKKTDDKWHSLLCESFIKEYVQYLQTLAFIPIGKISTGFNTRPNQERERIRQISGASVISSISSQSGGTDQGFSSCENISKRVRENSGQVQVQYLQKNLPGGIILFEVGFYEPFFYTKVYASETNRQSSRSLMSTHYKDVLAFNEECEKVKILMHLHSFTYDFHLRCIHAYISGRQVPFKPGYHLTHFLDDFIKYYPKGPSFARNTVHIGMLTVQNVSTPSHILYNYILTHEKMYQMKVLSTNTCSNSERNTEVADEYVLVKMYSKKITYNQEDEERQYDEFDLILVVAYDAPLMIRPYSSDPSVLRLKYYIILTSRRDIYPTLGEENQDLEGKLSIVNTPEALSRHRMLGRGSKTNSVEYKSKTRKTSFEDQTRHQRDSLEGSQKESEDYMDPLSDEMKVPFNGIKEELIHYMGYFSSHEQMMQQVVAEQIGGVETFVLDMVGQAGVDCRRDLLWQRLLIGEKHDDKQKNRKEDLISRETVGVLSYWEFGELLELVQVKSLSIMDPRLTSLLRQPIRFYQSLLKLITNGNMHCHRYFVAPDESIHQVALFCHHVDHAVVMLEINFDNKSADLSVLFKQTQEIAVDSTTKELELQGDILEHIESVINMCCYCAWANLL